MPSVVAVVRTAIVGLIACTLFVEGRDACGALVNVDVTAPLQFDTEFDAQVGNDYPPRVRSTLEIPIPDLTISGGDRLRVALAFAGNQYFQRLPPPTGGFARYRFELFLKNEPVYPAAVVYGEEVNRRVRVLGRSGADSFEGAGVSQFHVELTHRDIWGAMLLAFGGSNSGEPLQAETGSGLVFEWPIPQFLHNHPSLPEPVQFGSRTFAHSVLTIQFETDGPFGGSPGMASALVVPEPAAPAGVLASALVISARLRSVRRPSAG